MTTPRLGTIIGGSRYAVGSLDNVQHSLDLLDLDAGATRPQIIPLDFLAHGFAPHPRRPEAALLEKRGPGGAYVDLTRRTVLRPIAPMDGHHFYGHGAFSREADVLFAVESDLASGDGAISVRDPEGFAVIDTFPTHGKAPHDAFLIEDGKTLAITNGGGPAGSDDLPCVCFVDVASRKLLERFPVSEPRINAGHVAVAQRRAFVLVSAPRDGLPPNGLGGVSIRAAGGKLAYARKPEAVTGRMLGESLSVCIHAPTRTALATHPLGGLITFWNIDSGALLAAVDLPNPRGVTLTLDQRHYVVSFGPKASVLLIRTSPLDLVRDRDPGMRLFSGSHIYAWAAPAS